MYNLYVLSGSMVLYTFFVLCVSSIFVFRRINRFVFKRSNRWLARSLAAYCSSNETCFTNPERRNSHRLAWSNRLHVASNKMALATPCLRFVSIRMSTPTAYPATPRGRQCTANHRPLQHKPPPNKLIAQETKNHRHQCTQNRIAFDWTLCKAPQMHWTSLGGWP